MEKEAKREARKLQFGGYHLPLDDSVVFDLEGSSSRDVVGLVKEEGSLQTLRVNKDPWLELLRYMQHLDSSSP